MRCPAAFILGVSNCFYFVHQYSIALHDTNTGVLGVQASAPELAILNTNVCCPAATVKYSDVAPAPSVVITLPSHTTLYAWLVPDLFIKRTCAVLLASQVRVSQRVPV